MHCAKEPTKWRGSLEENTSTMDMNRGHEPIVVYGLVAHCVVGRRVNRRYATETLSLLFRGLKPTATVIASLREEPPPEEGLRPSVSICVNLWPKQAPNREC
jgi:hypothetical protein